MPVRADVATQTNGIKQTLTGIFVAFVNVAVQSLAWVILGFRNQLAQVIGVKNFHDCDASFAESASTICLTVFLTVNSRSNKAMQRADKLELVSI